MAYPDAEPPEDELVALLHLRLLPGLSDRRLQELLEQHGSARDVLRLPARSLGEEAASARDWMPVRERLRRARALIDGLDLRPLVLGYAAYPPALLELHDPPCFVFARGRLELLERPAVAMVGARRHTAYGASAAASLARGLSAAGVVVVSGLARGIDAAAHEAALAGGTIGVLGCGIDVVYPRQNAALQERIGAEGLLLSEFPLGAPALPHHFPQRNRIIAALSRAVVVVEASRKSGSLITAEHAMDLNRDVFAVPGPIGRETSEGTNQLLQDGAGFATSAEVILEALRLPLASPGGGGPAGESGRAPAGLAAAAAAILPHLCFEPLHVDELARLARVEAAAAGPALLELELAGHARRLPGARFVLP
ncbi:MAG TPA: DNA-processing protein DprA [Longimicrobiales bacterium]|nr:DNA-processing protein DprA [Longimicrobiales bacterium]